MRTTGHPWVVVVGAVCACCSGTWQPSLGSHSLTLRVELYVVCPSGLQGEPTTALELCVGLHGTRELAPLVVRRQVPKYPPSPPSPKGASNQQPVGGGG